MRIESPGFFDLQVNGFGGIDFNAPDLTLDRVDEALTLMRATGVTRCLPTLITSSFEAFARCARILARSSATAVAGIHMEGPYISPEDGARGAHPRAHVAAASVDDFMRRQDAAEGRIRLVTLAPEVSGAIALIEHLVASSVRVAIGHTAATPQQLADAISAGATMATHLGNGCAQMLPRHPNVIWELLATDAIFASMIVDGHHLPPATVKVMMRAKGTARTILVTDAIAAAGCAAGPYTIGGVDCELDEHGRVSLSGTPYLAGSALTLDRAIANTVRFTGLAIEAVLPMASTIPASYLGTATAGTVTADWDPDRGTLEIRNINRADGAPASDGAGGSGGAKPPGKHRNISRAEGAPAGAARGEGAPASDGAGGSGGAKPPGKR
jgi:N-acetylglucosamine-6-phosphate deacetylase